MVSFYDENRFKKLPSEAEWKHFKEQVEKEHGKLIYITKTFWHNSLTRCKGVITDMPILATHDSSSRPLAVTKIKVFEYNEELKKYDVVDTWVFNLDYAHTNINSEVDDYTIKDKDSEIIEISESQKEYKRKYRIYYESICNPITMHHFYTREEKELTLLFTGQLQGQNSGSPFRSVNSVANNYPDVAIRTITYGHFIKRTASVIQLLTNMTQDEIRNSIRDGRIHTKLVEKGVRTITEDEYYVKLIHNEKYIIVSKEELEAYQEKKEVSLYYPIIDKEQVDNILNNIPKIELDMTCIGLGSAGTGILDQVVRGNWFKKYMLVDFDYVEEKNLRNQWYNRLYLGNYKTDASKSIISNTIHDAEVLTRNTRFQEVDYSPYITKYIISGFDSIECRLELLQYVEEKKIDAKYIIDTRYDDLSASIYFIDTQNALDMDYYKKGLLSDKEAFDKINEERKIESEQQWLDYLKQKKVFENQCSAMQLDIYGSSSCGVPHCEGEQCKQKWIKIYNDYKERCNEIFRKDLPQEESSCVKWNLIDIYKFASSFVFAAIRDIEDGKEKQFTHVEATTDGLPRSIVLRK